MKRISEGEAVCIVGEYYVYQTTNLINGRYYIGKHNGNVDDDYLGSGKAIKEAIKKYGKENFTKDIIGTFQDEEQAYRYERLIVSYCIKDSKCYNIAEGGCGITSEARKKDWEKEEYRQKISETWDDDRRQKYSEMMRGRNLGNHLSEETKQKLSEAARKRMKDPKFKQKHNEAMRKPEHRQKLSEESRTKWKDPKFKQKIIEAIKKAKEDPTYRQKMSEANRGENNSNAKLKEDDVRDIKRRLMNGESVTNIAKDYNVSYNIICKIKNGKTWVHVQIN